MIRPELPTRVQQNLHPFSDRAQMVARLLNSGCSRAEAGSLLNKLTQGGGLFRLLNSCPHHRIGPALSQRIKALGIDTSGQRLRRAKHRLDHFAARCKLRNQLLRRQLAQAVSLLAGRGIRACLIKGAASLADDVPSGYLAAGVRPMEDLDIVVAPDDSEAALELIEERGWRCVSGTQPVPFRIDSPALVDVHTWSPGSAALGFLDFEEFFHRSADTSVGGQKVRVLKPAPAVQLRFAHNLIRQHLFIDFPLLDLYEMTKIISECPNRVDWLRIRSMAQMNGVSRVFYAVVLRLRDEFGAPVPEEVIPPAERRAAACALGLLRTFARAPKWLYCAASRYVLISSTPGGFIDAVNRANVVLFSRPLREAKSRLAPSRTTLPAKMLALHLAAYCWKVLRG